MKQIAFFDIDGTLRGFDGKRHRIPESTKVALKEFRENGNLAFICSGRPLRFILQEFGEDMFDGYICANGTYIVYKNKCIFNKTIDKDTIYEITKILDEVEIKCCFVEQNKGYSYKMGEEQIKKYNSQFKGGNYITEEWSTEDIQVNAFDVFYKDVIQLKRLKEHLGDSLIFNTHGPHMSADVSFKNWDKSDGIKYISKYLNIPIENTFAFGDGYNDVTMLKTAGIGIAMGNSVDELKAIASYVTNSIFDDGIYNAMVKYNLI